MNPVSAQQAALRILLEDVEPLLRKVEEVTTTLDSVRKHLNGDLEALSVQLKRSADAQPKLLELAGKLSATATRIEAATQQASRMPHAPCHTDRWAPRTLAVCVLSAVVTATVVAGIFLTASHATLEQARIGRALQSAWPSLDAATRTRLRELLDR